MMGRVDEEDAQDPSTADRYRMNATKLNDRETALNALFAKMEEMTRALGGLHPPPTASMLNISAGVDQKQTVTLARRRFESTETPQFGTMETKPSASQSLLSIAQNNQ